MSNNEIIPPIPGANKTPHPLNGFFSLDLDNLPIDENTPFWEKHREDGTTIKTYLLSPTGYELGTFERTTVTWFSPNEYNIHFYSRRPVLTQSLVDFINYCAKIYGPDKTGASYITNNDLEDCQILLFSRMWDDVYIHQDPTGTEEDEMMCLTIYYYRP